MGEFIQGYSFAQSRPGHLVKEDDRIPTLKEVCDQMRLYGMFHPSVKSRLQSDAVITTLQNTNMKDFTLQQKIAAEALHDAARGYLESFHETTDGAA